MHLTRQIVALCLLLACAMLPAAGVHAQNDPSQQSFDHFQTGFPLTGAHASVECASCHVGGKFVGTPRVCADCHNSVRAEGKPANHIQTQSTCDSCHTSKQWQVVRFDHSSVTGTCSSCHDGLRAAGKTATHPKTTQDCASCHNTSSWAGARFDHSGVSGSCASCHNGTTATGKTATHIATTAGCDSCHRTTAWTAGDLRSHRRERHLLVLPQRHERDRQKRHPYGDHQRLRCLPLNGHLQPGAQGRSHAGHRHLRELPQWHDCHRQNRDPHCDDCGLRQLSPYHRMDTGHLRSRQRKRHLFVLPQRHERDWQERYAYIDHQRLRCLPLNDHFQPVRARSTTPRSPAPAPVATMARPPQASPRPTSRRPLPATAATALRLGRRPLSTTAA